MEISAYQISRSEHAAGDRTELDFGLAALLDEFAYGVIVADLKGRVVHANQVARHELASSPLLSLRQNVLQTHRSDHARLLQEAIAKVAEGKRSMITFASGGGPTLTVAVLPLRGEPGRPTKRAVLLFARASVCQSLMLGFFARSHGLTGTEEHVLGILCQGYSMPEIAGQMKVAVSTVRSHVRSLCAKTCSSGVRQLVNRVAVLPPVVPALRLDQVH